MEVTLHEVSNELVFVSNGLVLVPLHRLAVGRFAVLLLGYVAVVG